MAKSVAKNAMALVASEAFNMACGVALVIVLARALGVADLGLFSFAYSTATVIYFASFFGMNDFAIRAVARDPRKAGEYYYNILVSRAALMAAGIIALDAALRISGYPPEKRTVVYLVMSARLIESLMFSFFAYFRAFQKMLYEAAIRGSMYLTATAASIFVIFKYRNIGIFALTQMSVYAVFFLIAYIASSRFVASKAKLSPFSARASAALFKGSAHISVIQVLLAVYVQTNTILLNFFKGDEATGIYAAGFRFVSVSGILAVSMTQAIFPHLSSLASGKDAARLKAAIGRARKYLFWSGLAISACIFAAAPFLVRLVYGDKFSAAVMPLYIMAFTPVFLFLNTGNNYFLYALDREKSYLKVLIGILLFTVAINLVLLPRFGAAGAAVTTFVPEALFFAVLSVSVRRAVRAA